MDIGRSFVNAGYPVDEVNEAIKIIYPYYLRLKNQENRQLVRPSVNAGSLRETLPSNLPRKPLPSVNELDSLDSHKSKIFEKKYLSKKFYIIAAASIIATIILSFILWFIFSGA